MKKRVRWGVLGCGQIAVDKMIPAMQCAENVELVAVADPLEERRNLVGVEGYTNYQALLADERIEAVYIALPTGMHLEAVLASAAAKKAILCEKPLSQSTSDVVQMLEAAERNGVKLMTAYMSRFGDIFQQACHALKSGAIGDMTFVYANFSYPALRSYPIGVPGSWRWTDPIGGGPLLDIGIYLAFGLRELLNQPIRVVNARATNTVAPSEAAVMDTNVAWFVTEGGIPGVFAATFSHQECCIIIYGTKGRLVLRDCFAQKPTGRLELTVDGKTTVTEASPDLPHFDNYRREVEHFSNAILTNSPYQPDAVAVLADTQLLDALKGMQV
jgi:D-xylose 1-dehydrogenase (NADP+, D-xylono-1,5-lactone-forming)